ncbi:restriction endonuclease subunit S [Bifidobacterium bifidum]|uniref:restriction endonuclease subunit S n=1 Tax=Bifidobacterium bifidum TaxID=1681 RepID=UPI001C6FF9AB|nr:restriction endonuclease subunit S [Bifidobacterium bifidum]
MTEQAKVPAIRFAGFTDPWEQRKLGEFGSVAMCKRIYKEQTSEQGDVPFFKIGTFGADPDAFISNELFEDYKRTYPYPTPGTLLISAAGSIGRIVEYQGEKAYFQDSNIVWLEHDHRLNDAFLKPLYSKIEWGLEGSTIKRLYNKDLLSAEVTIPDGREQKEIGQFFTKLDSLITLHQRKYDKLVVFKKSMLEKMFPKDGESVPEIRFAGFTDPWEQRKLSEVATFGGGHTPPMADPDNYEDGYVLWVTSQDVKSNYLDRTTTQITEKGAKELTLYPAGSLVMVTRSGILRHTLPVAELRKPSTVNQDIRVILPQGECCGEWLLQFFISHNKELLLEFGKTGTTVESVDFGKIKDMLLYMPSTVEQQQIGDYFAKLDSLITLHQRKLELLQNIKKSLLDKMFA